MFDSIGSIYRVLNAQHDCVCRTDGLDAVRDFLAGLDEDDRMTSSVTVDGEELSYGDVLDLAEAVLSGSDRIMIRRGVMITCDGQQSTRYSNDGSYTVAHEGRPKQVFSDLDDALVAAMGADYNDAHFGY